MADVLLLAAPGADDAAVVAVLLPALRIEMAVGVERRGEAIEVLVAALGMLRGAGEIEPDGLEAARWHLGLQIRWSTRRT